jgi:hypothetical protein
MVGLGKRTTGSVTKCISYQKLKMLVHRYFYLQIKSNLHINIFVTFKFFAIILSQLFEEYLKNWLN